MFPGTVSEARETQPPLAADPAGFTLLPNFAQMHTVPTEFCVSGYGSATLDVAPGSQDGFAECELQPVADVVKPRLDIEPLRQQTRAAPGSRRWEADAPVWRRSDQEPYSNRLAPHPEAQSGQMEAQAPAESAVRPSRGLHRTIAPEAQQFDVQQTMSEEEGATRAQDAAT